ncbi:MAG: autoinducer 2 ABC transporter substrate-binding protein [Anaerolineae bacterium]|nr:autoinducer 2 ABC transporter substrate-binding protein [Candidatus Roseilinea sp.]MDW8451416.1 autoinducer 2 ABC transporter substrate-binding protein [Anaerolineae bacterium]
MSRINFTSQKLSRRQVLRGAALLGIGGLAAACAAPPAAQPAAQQPAPQQPTEVPKPAADAKGTYAVVVKIAGINWFNRMEEGVKEWGSENGVQAFLTGPEKADAALQIPIIENLIAQKVSALGVVPMDPDVLDPVLKKAMDAGIAVITHEASNQKSMHWDIEAFDNTAYGAHLMDFIAEKIGGEGEYAVFVGSLGSKTHNEWVDGGIARQKEKYPNMKLVGDKQETKDDSQIAYQKMKELLKAYPNLRAVQTSASTDAAGVGQAIEEAGLVGKIVVAGTSLPSISGKFIESGAVNMISFWDPKIAGKAMLKLAMMHLKGEPIGDGMNLGLPGYEKLIAKGRVLYGNAWVDVTKENLSQYPF